MSVEIREIVLKTEITVNKNNDSKKLDDAAIKALKQSLLAETKRNIKK